MPFERPPKPLVSSRAHEPDVEEEIDAFVVTLGEWVDRLQDAEALGDGRTLRRAAEELAGRAEQLGYAPMAEAARAVAAACDEAVPEAVHKRVVDVTTLSQRIRRGHRSAA